jgi:acetylornithine/succinyldiaminopimelate/putrescine aminotransferase
MKEPRAIASAPSAAAPSAAAPSAAPAAGVPSAGAPSAGASSAGAASYAASSAASSAAAGVAAAAKSHLAQVFAQFPLEIAHGEGVWLTTRDGRKLLDFYGGHAVAGLGYGHPRWLAALERQARQLAFQTNALPLTVRERAAARLTRFAGLGLDTVFWLNSGAEANENALKLAFKITGRGRAVALEHSFHGRTAAAGAVTWGAAAKWYGFPRAPFEVSFTPRDNTAALEAQVTEQTAAVIVEPIQGMGGAYELSKTFLSVLRRRCDEVGAVLIFDEVQSGMGRSGAPFAAHASGVVPDILTAAKALGNGFPVAALLLSRRISKQLKVDDMGTTFGGGPMACAVAEAVIDTIESEALLANVRQVSAYLRAHCEVGPVVGVQGAGFLLGLKTSRPAREVQAALLEQNILTGTSADPRILRLLPAYIINESHVDRLIAALARIPP